jgi:predicted CoA-binding protein
MLQLKKWAVLGASANPNKFGYRIFRVLRRYGYEVYPVNPRETTIDGERCFPSLKELPIVPDVVDFVVPPSVALDALVECKAFGIKNVWLQPGVNTPEVIAKAHSLGITVISDACAMVESSKPAMLKQKTWAVVGAADDLMAEAERISTQLRQKGYTVSLLLVALEETNTKLPSFAALPQKPEVVLVAGNTALTEGVLKECHSAGIDFVWLQPGTESDALIDFGNSLNLVIVHHANIAEELA